MYIHNFMEFGEIEILRDTVTRSIFFSDYKTFLGPAICIADLTYLLF